MSCETLSLVYCKDVASVWSISESRDYYSKNQPFYIQYLAHAEIAVVDVLADGETHPSIVWGKGVYV
jgi:hypothetical protein